MSFGSTTITYNGLSFSNGSSSSPSALPVPLVSKSVDYVGPDGGGGEGRLCRRETITLNGQILDCDLDFKSSRDSIFNAFSEDFHTLEIDGIDNIELIRVMSVEVGDQEGAKGFVDYSITLEAYPEDSFASSYRVLDPVDQSEISENEDATATLTHTVSCRGLNTSSSAPSNALSNAKSFVSAKIGAGCLKGVLIKSKDPNWGKFLVTVTEDINRITAEYSMTKVYTSDQTRKAGGEIVARSTKTITDQYGESRKITYSGKVEGGREGDIDDVREAFKEMRAEFNNEVAVAFPFLESEDITEDEVNTTITFTISLDANPTEVIDDYNVTVSETSSSSLINVTINGKVTARGPKKCRLDKIRNHFGGNPANAKGINGRYGGFCQTAYGEYVADFNVPAVQGVAFNDDPLSVSVTENKFEPSIQYSMQFDNRICYGHHKVSHTMNFKPSLNHIATKELNRPSTCVNQACQNDDGGQASFDLLYMGFRDRCEFGIQGQITVYSGGGTSMENLANLKFRKYCTIDSDELQTSKTESEDRAANASYDYKWTFHGGKAVTAVGNYKTVSTLAM